jgi:hypothetical protein
LAFPPISYMHSSPPPLPIDAAWPTHLILRGLTILIIFTGDHKLWSSSLRSFLQPPIT